MLFDWLVTGHILDVNPAHAVRGSGDILVSTFEFAGVVRYDPAESAPVEARQ